MCAVLQAALKILYRESLVNITQLHALTHACAHAIIHMHVQICYAIDVHSSIGGIHALINRCMG